MKRFLINLGLFALPIMTFFLSMANIKISDEYIIYKTQETGYDKIAFNLKLIKFNPERINNALVFLGPSIFQGGVSDEILNNEGIRSINLAVNHTGKEIELYFFKRILAFKPKKVYFFSNHEFVDLHPMTPLLYDPLLLISSGQFINSSFVNYFFKRVLFVADYIKWHVTNQKITQVKSNAPTWGVVYEKSSYSDDDFKTIQTYFNEDKVVSLKDKLIESLKSVKRAIFDNYIIRDIISNSTSQHRFLLSIVHTANNNDIEIAGFYVPMIEDTLPGRSSKNKLFFADSVLRIEALDNFEFLSKGIYWSDLHHLSKDGSIYFARELIRTNLFK